MRPQLRASVALLALLPLWVGGERAAAQARPAQQVTSPILLWQPGVKLRWKDFEAVAPPPADLSPDVRVAACCVARIMVTPTATKKGQGTFLVASFLVKPYSWVRDSTTAQNQLLLAHEQLHFDINELFARKIRQRVAQYAQAGRYAFGPELAREIRSLLDVKVAFNAAFDAQAHQDQGEGPIRHWQALVLQELDKLTRYQSTADMCDFSAIDWLEFSRAAPHVRVP